METISSIARPATPAPGSPGDRHDASAPEAQARGDRSFARLAGALIAFGVVAYGIVLALEPTPAHPELAYSWWAQLLDVAFLASACLGTIALLQRRPIGFTGIAASSVLLLVGVVACPTTGHHEFGVWWLGQLAVSAAWVAASVYATRVGYLRAADSDYGLVAAPDRRR